MNKFDWNSFPKYTINIGKLSMPYAICNIFDHRRIDKYVYCIMFKGIVIKYGMSAPGIIRVRGERLYRQLAHCYSWGPQRIDGSSGADWLIIERDFKNLYGVNIDHKDISVTVWDVTNYPFQSFNPFNEVEAMESEKIDEYVQLIGQKPIGNINDEANKRDRSFVSKSLYNKLFIETVEYEQ
jgi:hypothetical protein